MHARMQSTPVAPATAPRCHCIVKLGGSAITNKHDLETLKPDVLKSVCSSIQQLYIDAGDRGKIVLVHGAGSFGHFQASQYGVAKGGNDAGSAITGFVQTRRSVTRLNHHVVSTLIDQGVPAVGISPCATWATSNRQLSLQGASVGLAAVTEVLQHGMVPVLHGDCVFDAQLGVTILSGDTIIRALAEALQPKYCVFLTDVAGLFSKPPEQEGAVFIPAVEVAADGSWHVPQPTPPPAALAASATTALGSASGSTSTVADSPTAAAAVAVTGHSSGSVAVQLSAADHDTTGGIATKIAEAAAVVLAGCPVVIAQAGTASGTAAVLHGPAAFTTTAASEAVQSSSAGNAQQQQQQEQVLRATVIRPAC